MFNKKSNNKSSKQEKKLAINHDRYLKKEIKRKEKAEKKRVKSLKKAISRFHSTTEWLEIEGVTDDLVVLSEKVAVMGYMIIPPDVFSLGDRGREQWVSRLTYVFNNIDLELFHVPFDSPIFVDNFINDLASQIDDNTPDNIRDIIENEMDNYRDLSRSNPRKEFCMMTRGNPNDKRFMKKVFDLRRLLLNNGFNIRKLNKTDYENIFAYIFENDLINDYFFSNGVFEDMEYYEAPLPTRVKEDVKLVLDGAIDKTDTEVKINESIN